MNKMSVPGARRTVSSQPSEDTDLPIVIPHPQVMRKIGNEPIVLGKTGQLLAEVVALENDNLFVESKALIESTLRRRVPIAVSQPTLTTIFLITKSAFGQSKSSLPDLPVLTPPESDALARSEQAYVIRMRPGAQAKVWIIGASPLGVFYGVSTFVQLVSFTEPGTIVMPQIEVQDYPDMPGRMCANWCLKWDWDTNGYDWGDGLKAFLDRCKRKIDFCAQYKVNRIRFLGGLISPGPAYMQDRYEKIRCFALELNRYARRKGVALQYSSSSIGYDHCGWGHASGTTWVVNRESYPDGPTYSCGRDCNGGCLANDDLIEMIANRQKQLVQDIEPSSIYLHNFDTGHYSDLVDVWHLRCPRCRQRFPDDTPYSARGYAGAVANLYNRITARLRTVKNAASGYDAARDLEIVYASPGYTCWSENDAEWENEIKYFSEIARQVTDKRNVQITFREQFNRLDGRGLRIEEMSRALEQVGWPNAMFVFAVQGADFLDSPNMFVSSPVLTETYRGAGTLYNFNGHVHSELQVLANVNYAWNHHAPGAVDPGQFPGTALREEASRYSTGKRHSDFLFGRFMKTACALLYGEKAAPWMIDLFRFERDNGPIVPHVAWLQFCQHFLRIACGYNWQTQADRNLQAKSWVDRAVAACDTEAKVDLLWLRQCLEVSAKIFVLGDSVYRKNLSNAEIDSRSDALTAWLNANFEFQVTEPDGGEPGLWKQVIRRMGSEITIPIDAVLCNDLKGPAINIFLKNFLVQLVSGQIKVASLPVGMTLVNAAKDYAFGPLAQEQESIITLPVRISGEVRGSLTVRLQTGEREQCLQKEVRLINSQKTDKPLKIDGDLNGKGWSFPVALDNREQISYGRKAFWKGKEELSALVYSRWDKDNLYFGIDVKDQQLMVCPYVSGLYNASSVELFFDTAQGENIFYNNYTDRCAQLVFAPACNGHPLRICLSQAGRGKKMDQKGIEAVSRPTADGYQMEIKAPVRELGLDQLRKGDIIGFNVAINAGEMFKEQIKRRYQMTWNGQSCVCGDRRQMESLVCE